MGDDEDFAQFMAAALPGLLRGDRLHAHAGSYDERPALGHDDLPGARSADPVLVW